MGKTYSLLLKFVKLFGKSPYFLRKQFIYFMDMLDRPQTRHRHNLLKKTLIKNTEAPMLTINIKVIVFDLDGTLYEDTHHFEFYAKRLQNKLTGANQTSFWEDYQSALKGMHTIKIGRIYDAENDLVLVQEDNRVKEVYSWEGKLLGSSDRLEIYPLPITIEQRRMISIGDLWWVPSAIARHHGLSPENTSEAFLETRSFMMGPEFQMERVSGFKQALLGLKKKGLKIVLLTNSPESDSEVILTKLGFEKLFDWKIFEGQKPTHTAERFTQIKEHFYVEFNEIVSIGDNWINEILPAAKLGCSTVLIDPHQISDKSYADKIVKNLSGLIPILNHLAETH